jgi:nitroimidazol reductase NimA-like FMN-containing flavoprotein (pyridoxamine 5'-phosphate oxidase superfamily)
MNGHQVKTMPAGAGRNYSFTAAVSYNATMSEIQPEIQPESHPDAIAKATTPRLQVRRLPTRGAYDAPTIHAILDEGLICHVGFVYDGSPFVIPTGYARVGDRLLIHGSSASRMMRALSLEAEACITVTLIDGLVLARSAFNHSMNYRSVVVLAKGEKIEEPEAKMQALEQITERLVPHRWKDIRWPSDKEMKATTVLAFPLTESSAKIRTGPPHDDEEDYALKVWAGVLPLALTPGQPIPDEKNLPNLQVPPYISNSKR